MGRMADGGTFKRVSRREFSRQSALQGEAPDKERQQAEQHEQKNMNGERRHQNRPSALRLRLAVIVTRLQFAPQLAQV